MSKTVLFLHDTSLSTPRGAELTINQLVDLGEKRGHEVLIDNLNSFEHTKQLVSQADILVYCSSSRCSYEIDLIEHILSIDIPYIKIEYDYNFCVRRNILCTVDKSVRNCCNSKKFHTYRKLFAKAQLNAFQSPNHYEAHREFYGEAASNRIIMPPTVSVDDLKPSDKKIEDTIPFFGDLSYLKGGMAYIAYAEENPEIKFPVYGKNRLRQSIPQNITFREPISNQEVLEILGRTKTFFCQPVWPEPSGRLVAEAFLSGCNIIGNDRIGTFSFDFYPHDKDRAKKEMKDTLVDFWKETENILIKKEKQTSQNLGKVLVYKSYGGLGDIFFAIPAINKLVEVSDWVYFAVAPRLVNFFTQNLNHVTVVDEEIARNEEHLYDNIYELGNYPAFMGYELPHALKYPTHKKVKQHAIGHYIDTVSKLHISINNKHETYPYFDRKEATEDYYVVHHGAGFLLKIWPTEKYAELIEKLWNIYPQLKCKIIQGPKDPDIKKYFSKPMPHIKYITGGMEDVGEAMSGALFHIGNDAGITHVAGAYNVPTVGIYGPTGPGSWGNFSEYNEIIWGKHGVCDIRCNYDVILNCDHKICLQSITINRVLSAIYKLLQKAYPKKKSILKVNPYIDVDYSKKDCLITLNGNEFFLEYHNDTMKNQIEALLKTETVDDLPDETFKLVLDVLNQQDIVFNIPVFN